MCLARVGARGNEFVWTNCVLSRGACLPRNKPLPIISGSECDFLKPFLFQQFSAFRWIGDGGLQAGLPSCPAKSSERIRADGHNELLHRSSCAGILRGIVDSSSFVSLSFEVV